MTKTQLAVQQLLIKDPKTLAWKLQLLDQIRAFVTHVDQKTMVESAAKAMELAKLIDFSAITDQAKQLADKAGKEGDATALRELLELLDRADADYDLAKLWSEIDKR